jgi:hypothetical protein
MFARLVDMDYAACPHVLQVHDGPDVRRLRALTSGVSETCVRALRTCGPNRTDRPARLFFMYAAHKPQGTIGRVAA